MHLRMFKVLIQWKLIQYLQIDKTKTTNSHLVDYKKQSAVFIFLLKLACT